MRTLATLAGASFLALAGASAMAQTPPAPPAPDQQAQTRRNDASALLDARVAGIKAGLKLTPEQERLFAPVEQAYRAMAAERARRMEERRDERVRRSEDRHRPDLMERLDRRAERATQNAQRIAGFATAMRPFWASLNEDQKRLLPRLMHAGAGPGHGRWMAMMHPHHGGGMGRDMMERPGMMDRSPDRTERHGDRP